MKPLATVALVLMALMPAAAAPTPAVKSVQCPPGHMVTGGYCTHQCTADSDCCAAAGECPYSYAEVCAPFESMAGMRCFLSCEDADLKKANATDADVFCHTYASAAFNCRSTGGGSKNRKVCLP